MHTHITADINGLAKTLEIPNLQSLTSWTFLHSKGTGYAVLTRANEEKKGMYNTSYMVAEVSVRSESDGSKVIVSMLDSFTTGRVSSTGHLHVENPTPVQNITPSRRVYRS